jgi:hypothetical protein
MGIKEAILNARREIEIVALLAKARAMAQSTGPKCLHPGTLRKCERAAEKRRLELHKE